VKITRSGPRGGVAA